MGCNTSHFINRDEEFAFLEDEYTFHLTKKGDSFIVWNSEKTDRNFLELCERRAVLDTFIDFLDTNLLLIHAVWHHSFDNVQKALMEGAIPDMPCVHQHRKSLLHFCYEIPRDYYSDMRKIGRELIYWGADTKALLAALPPGFITTPESTQHAKDDITQIEKVKGIVNRMIAKRNASQSWCLNSRYTPVLALLEIYNESGLSVSHKGVLGQINLLSELCGTEILPDTGQNLRLGYYGHQLVEIKKELDPKYAKETVNETGTFCGLGNFILDPVKRNLMMDHWYSGIESVSLDGLTTLRPDEPGNNKIKEGIPRKLTWCEEGVTSNSFLMNTLRLEKAVYQNDAKKLAGILLWFIRYRQRHNNPEIIDGIFECLWTQAAKNQQYEIITLLVNAHSKRTMFEASLDLLNNPATNRAGRLLLCSPHRAPLITQALEGIPKDVSSLIFGFFARASKKEFMDDFTKSNSKQVSDASTNSPNA